MLTIYGTDVPSMTVSDWEDALCTGAFPADADWENADLSWSEPMAFAVRETEETRDLPVREFAVDLDYKDAEPFAMPEELADLLDDIGRMKELMRPLYRLKPYDAELRDMVEAAQEAFAEAYDCALRKAVRLIIMEAYRKRGE